MARFLQTAAFICATMILFSCDFLSSGRDDAGICIDLGESFGSGAERAIGTPPTAIEAFSVTVSGPGMNTVVKEVSRGTRYLTMWVPAGPGRIITVEARVDIVSPGPLQSYSGSAVLDLRPGRISGANIRMGQGAMDIVIPEAREYGMGGFPGKIVHIPNMNPAASDWREYYYGFSTPTTTALRPTCADTDREGFIYFGQGFVNGGYWLGKITQYQDPVPAQGLTWIYRATMNMVSRVVVDNVFDRVYYIHSGVIYWTDYQLSGEQFLVLPDISSPTGVAVDEQGMLYITGWDSTAGSTGYRVFHFNPFSGSRLAASTLQFTGLRDVCVKNNRVYTIRNTTYNTVKYEEIAVFSGSLDFIGTYGSPVSPENQDDRTPGHFYGPMIFIARSNKKIVIMDDTDAPGANPHNRIVAFADPSTWDGWEEFHPGQIGQTDFAFFC